MSTIKKPTETVFPWLRENLGKQCLGCLTGYSGKAVLAAFQVIVAYNSSDERAEKALLQSFRLIVETLDRPERELVYHSIAHVMNWWDRALIFEKAGLPPIENPSRCKYE